MTDQTFEKDLKRIPGLYRSYEFAAVVAPRRAHRVEEAGTTDCGTPLYAIWREDDPLALSADRHVTPRELGQRWRVTERTLDRWRVSGTGPQWLRICGRILYRAEDVLAFEALRLRGPKP